MFERVVSQVLAGYLGRYVKGIQEDQLKIAIWKEKVELENVDLILEAFDYLQLPFALREGRVGKLSITIPWKKLGWEPIIVGLENVFICACQREEDEWTSDSVERRELAGKMAKLNAAELAKLSRRVSNNQAGQSFISYISAKILDNIQVSIRNVHIKYIDSHTDQEKFVFGLIFSSLTIMTDAQKQSSNVPSSGKMRAGQVNKIVEISNVGLYCNLLEENLHLFSVDYTNGFVKEMYDYLVDPFDVTVYLLANKSGKLDSSPQYAVTTEISTLVVSLNEIQLQQILGLCDYLFICSLREKYGRYRPSQNSISMKLNGWQKMWWHYAQRSVLADVRQKLRKTSWRYLGTRISERRRYIHLYRTKLEQLQNEQLVNKDILHELDKMDKECDIDDILRYRSTAEQQLQELQLIHKSHNTGINSSAPFLEKHQNDERSSSRARGWLNWLSLGMLGAGGTADSSSFAGVVSDEVIKDIHEATSFHPASCFDENSSIMDNICVTSIKLRVLQIIISLSTKRHKRKIAKAIFGGISTECKYMEDSATIMALADSLKIINPYNENIILTAKKAVVEESWSIHVQPFINVQVNMPPSNLNIDFLIKISLQPFEAMYESDFFLDLSLFFHVYTSFPFQHNRVISSLNGLKDFKARLLSKAEYVLFNRKKLNWDVSFRNVSIKFPLLEDKYSVAQLMILNLEALALRSQMSDTGYCHNFMSSTCLPDSKDSTLHSQLHDLYDGFEIKLTAFEVNMSMPKFSKTVSVIEKFNNSVAFGMCIFLDEPMLRHLEVKFSGTSLGIHISPDIIDAFVKLDSRIRLSKTKSGAEWSSLHINEYNKPNGQCSFNFSASIQLDTFSFHADLEDDSENGSVVSSTLGDIDIRYSQEHNTEVWIFVKTMMVDAFNVKNKASSYKLCSSRNSPSRTSPVHVEFGSIIQDMTCKEGLSCKGCIQLHYLFQGDGSIVHHDICFSDVDLHIYPRISGLIKNFINGVLYNDSVHQSGTPTYSNEIIMKFILNGVWAHFHDSSCILGTIALPTAKASLTFRGTDWNALLSVDGLNLYSSWSSAFWGSFSPSISSVINISVRKEERETSLPLTEISIVIQHVGCILPSEYLAIVIGYFSLPDWEFENSEPFNSQDTHGDLLYKFEILDSDLIFPVEGHSDYCLKIDLPQLYCSFSQERSSGGSFRDIPIECILPKSTASDRLNIINISGRNTSLSLLLLDNDTSVLLKLDECTTKRKIPVIAQLDADLWIRIPCGTNHSNSQSAVHSLIMMRTHICNLIAEDEYFFDGLESAMVAIDQLCSVGKESEKFQSDVLNFLQLKRAQNENSHASINISNESFLSMKFWIKSMTIKFTRSRVENSTSSKTVTEADMRLNVTVHLKNDKLKFLDVDISQLLLCSFLSQNPLALFIPHDSLSSHLCIIFSKSDHGESQLLLAIPYLEIWLHLSDWSSFIDLLYSYTRQPGSISCSSSKNPQSGFHGGPDSPKSSCSVSDDAIEEVVDLTISSEDIAISFHLPLKDKVDHLTKTNTVKAHKFYPHSMNSALSFELEHSKYIKLSLQSKYCKVTVGKSYVTLKCNVEKMRLLLEMIQNSKIVSMPFVHISQINLATELRGKQGERMHISSDVQVESLDVGFSHHTFNFWACSQLEVPQSESSLNISHCVVFKVNLKKGSLLLSDGRWSYHGPILEILMKNVLIDIKQAENIIDSLSFVNLTVNYNNIDKGMWEPFVEPWCLQLNLVRKNVGNPPNTPATASVDLNSIQHLNLNITEPLIEASFRLYQMIKDALNQNAADRIQENLGNFGYHPMDDVQTRRYAPYILRNDTFLPLIFHVSHGPLNEDFSMKKDNVVQPGFSVPIFVEETLDEHFLRRKTGYSSERLIDKEMSFVAHHMISVQLDGTFGPSKPMSMDLVGISYFEVDFSKSKSTSMIEVGKGDFNASCRKIEERFRSDQSKGLIVPVVFEVSMQHYSKIIRLYSTVILFNATSIPLELRFDIPFGVSPKILDPILPGQEMPLPLHLAQTGRVRWRPVGSSYLWSKAHSLSNLLLQEKRIGSFRSFVCYPSVPNSDPFRCCISVQDYSLSSSGGAKKSSSIDSRRKPVIHHVNLTAPLLVKNYLPVGFTLMIDSGGVAHSFSLSEVGTASVFLIDSAHGLGFTFCVEGFRPTISKFPRPESFSSMAKLSGSRFSLSETLIFYPETYSGPLWVTLEKSMDAFCGARELCLSVSFLLYNCTGLLLTMEGLNHGNKCSPHVIPSGYDKTGHEKLPDTKRGTAIVTSELGSPPRNTDINNSGNFSRNHILSIREIANLNSYMLSTRHFHEASGERSGNGRVVSTPLYFSGEIENCSDHIQDGGSRKVKAYMYGPPDPFPATELMVKLCASLPQTGIVDTRSQPWSIPFSLLPASGSTSIVIPQSCGNSAFLVSVTSIPVAGELSGTTRAITFQPRFVICNTCEKDLCYKQKGTDIFHRLSTGQHSDLHWSDTTRELLVSIRLNEPGWQWSGSFLPDCLGDAQVKMRNYVSGVSSMVRVEVQNVDLAINDEKNISNSNGNSATQLILLSDDKTGFMPYRIENFSMERLRVYQQRCESSETIVHPYTSCQFAWDEPCCPHRLIIEVPGERILGLYSLDDVKEYGPVFLPSTSEKPERRLYVSLHAEGVIKVLNIIDSNYHIIEDMEVAGFLGHEDKKEVDKIEDDPLNFSEHIKLHFRYIGISLISSSSQELVFACAKDTTVVAIQCLDQQKISVEISAIQIDNQLSDTPYPIMLSFGNEHRRKSMNIVRYKESKLRSQNGIVRSRFDSSCDSILYLAAAKWRNADTSLVSFKFISIRLAPLSIELEEQVFLGLFNFVRTVSSRLKNRASQKRLELQTPDYSSDVPREYTSVAQNYKYGQHNLLKDSKTQNSQLLPSVSPVGAPWQQIYLSARKRKKIYVEVFELAPIRFSLSFSSSPWMIRNEGNAEMDLRNHMSNSILQRGLMALVDVEGVPVNLGLLKLEHLMASQESIQEILIRHYARQLLHEMYKVFGSAGVIGNPVGFARNVGRGIKEFLSASSNGNVQSPTGILTGVAKGSKNLLNDTVYAMSSAATQFSKAAHKGIVAFTFDEQAVYRMDEQLKGLDSHGKGVLNGFLEGLTGLLQSPIRGAEKHGLPGILSGIAIGMAGLVAKPAASILEAMGKTAQSIRNRSSPHQSNRLRARFPRPLARELPLLPYSWEEAIGVSMLLQADGSRLRDEIFIMCKTLKEPGRFITITKRLVLTVLCQCLTDFADVDFSGVPIRPDWVLDMEMGLESIVYIDRTADSVNIVGSNAERPSKPRRGGSGGGGGARNRAWSPPVSAPLFHMSVELPNVEEAEDMLQVLLSAIEQGKERRWGTHLLHRYNLR